MPDKPHLIFDVMDSEVEPTDEQLEELMRHVGEAIRAETTQIDAILKANPVLAAQYDERMKMIASIKAEAWQSISRW